MTILQAVFLGTLKGITEFLPLSSSGHLLLFQEINVSLTGEQDHLFFKMSLNLSTLLSIIFVFRMELLKLISSLIGLFKDLIAKKNILKTEDENKKLVLILICANLPMLLSIFFQGMLDSMSKNLLFIAIALGINGIILTICEQLKDHQITEKNATFMESFTVGILRFFSIIPGLSKTGMTLFGSKVNGFSKEFAMKFVFLLYVPEMIGAVIWNFIIILKGGSFTNQYIGAYLLGMIACVVTGIYAIRLLIWLIQKQKLKYCSYYAWILAIFAFLIWFRG